MLNVKLVTLGLQTIFYVCHGLEVMESYKVEFGETVIEVFKNELVSPKCMQCICQVESRCQEIGCQMGPGFLQCGPFQITEPFWEDCGRPGEDYQTCTKDYSCSYKCVEAYMKRYIGPSGCLHNCESYARIHKGGPTGCYNSITLGFLNKVKEQGCTKDS